MANTLSLFNLQWYLDQNDDVKSAVENGSIGGFEHFLLYGQYEGRSPGPLFDSAAYLKNNTDVNAAVEAGEMTAYEHFINYGASEGRSPISLFEADFYLQQNSDVSEAVDAGDMSAVEHFLLYGQNEARAFSPSIDLGKYLIANADVAKAVEAGDMSAMEHLLLYGVSEGRDLGNGVNLGIFAEDPKFVQALEEGDVEAALGRVAEVAPFLPSFQPPTDWTPAPDTPIPVDFTPPEDVKLVVPDGVVVPDDMELPDTFEPIEEDGGTTPPPPEPKEFTLAEAMAAKEDGELPDKYILTDDALTAEDVSDVTVAGLAAAQDAAIEALRTSDIVANAENGAEIVINNGAYTLADSLENIENPDNEGIVAGAESVAVRVVPGESIQNPIDGGWNVLLDAGDHTGQTNLAGISEDLTISGANAGLAGDDESREDETVLDAGTHNYAVDVLSGTHEGDVTIDGVKVLAGKWGGIVQGVGTEETGALSVVNSKIIAPEEGFTARGNGVLLSGQGSSVKDSMIEMTYFSPQTDGWSTSGVAVFDYANDVEISGNHIYARDQALENGSIIGIGLDASYTSQDLDSVVIQENTFETLSVGVSLMGAVGGDIEDNIFKDNTTAISFGHTIAKYVDEFDVTIKGNTFDGNGRAIAFQDVDGVSKVTITDNTFVDLDTQDAIVFNFGGDTVYDRFDDLTVAVDVTQFRMGDALVDGVFVAHGTDWADAGDYLLHDSSTYDQSAGTAMLAWDFDEDGNVDLTVELTGLSAADFVGEGYMDLFG